MSKIKLNQEHYNLLKKCSEMNNFAEWNNFVDQFKEPKQIIRLRKADFQDIDLHGVNFQCPNNKHADLFEANFKGAKIKGCNFSNA